MDFLLCNLFVINCIKVLVMTSIVGECCRIRLHYCPSGGQYWLRSRRLLYCVLLSTDPCMAYYLLITAFFSSACSPNMEVINHSTKICVSCLTCVFVGVRVASESVNSCVKFPLKYIVVDNNHSGDTLLQKLTDLSAVCGMRK